MSVEVTEANFEQEVLTKSSQTPVVVDFWAPWCGPCRMIGPVLEKLEKEYAGRFLLAKLDTDENQKLAGRYRISGIPDIKMFKEGEVVDQFTGALPEPQVRKFLDRWCPDEKTEALFNLSAGSPQDAADHILTENMQGEDAEEILWLALKDHLQNESPSRAERILELMRPIPEVGSKYSTVHEHFIKALAMENGTDIAAMLGNVCRENMERTALGCFLDLFEKSSGDMKESAKNALLASFQLLGNSSDLVNEYRRKLSSLLY